MEPSVEPCSDTIPPACLLRLKDFSAFSFSTPKKWNLLRSGTGLPPDVHRGERPRSRQCAWSFRFDSWRAVYSQVSCLLIQRRVRNGGMLFFRGQCMRRSDFPAAFATRRYYDGGVSDAPLNLHIV